MTGQLVFLFLLFDVLDRSNFVLRRRTTTAGCSLARKISHASPRSFLGVERMVRSIHARRSHPSAIRGMPRKVQGPTEPSTEGMEGRIDALPNLSEEGAGSGSRCPSLGCFGSPFATASVPYKVFEHSDIVGKRIIQVRSRKFLHHRDTAGKKNKQKKEEVNMSVVRDDEGKKANTPCYSPKCYYRNDCTHT